MRKTEKDDLDTTTTFVDMNVEGFRWYHPKGKDAMPQLTKEESRAMLTGALKALVPILLGVLSVFLMLAGLAYLWLS